MKREPLGNERDQDRWLGNSLRQAATPPSEGCPDAETLAAWADGGLNAQAASAVELHASTCARCMAVAATMARTAPALSASRAWTPARAVRWLIPLTAAATAVAIWVAVPQRSVIDDLKTGAPATELTVPVPAAPDSAAGSGSAADSARGATGSTSAARGVAEPSTQGQSTAPNTENRESAAELQAQPQEQQFRDDDLRRERVAPPAQEFALEVPRAAPEAAPAAPPPSTAAAPAAQAPPPQAANAAGANAAAAKDVTEASPSLTSDMLSETVTTAQQRSALTARAAVTAEARVPKNARIRWRVIARAAIERSLDGGKTWIETSPLPRDSVKGLTITGIRAMSDQNAIVQMSNGVEFLTSNGGMSWVQLQEK